MIDNGKVKVDRSKHNKLEMPMFVRKNLESWMYRVGNSFETNDLPKSVEVKPAVVSCGQDEVN